MAIPINDHLKRLHDGNSKNTLGHLKQLGHLKEVGSLKRMGKSPEFPEFQGGTLLDFGRP